MPYRDENNQYPIDPNGIETVNWYKINYRKAEAEAILEDRKLKLKSDNIKEQQQLNLFN